MTSLYDAEFGADAVVIQRAAGLLRRVRHSDASLVIDNDNEVSLNLNLSEAHAVERRMGGRLSRDVPRIGAVTIMPPGCPTRFDIKGECRVLQLRLIWSEMIGWLAEEDGPDPAAMELQPRMHEDDAILARLIYAMAITDQNGVETAARHVTAHLFGKYSGRMPVPPTPARGGLPANRLRRVLDLIEDDLADALPLRRLAATAGMSPFHFAREFARATGLPPHRYVVRRRVDRAVQLLCHPTATTAEVARDVGFTHASHLTRRMRQLMGVTPVVLRRLILP